MPIDPTTQDLLAAMNAANQSNVTLAYTTAVESQQNADISGEQSLNTGEAQKTKTRVDGITAAAAAVGGTASNVNKATFGVAGAIAGSFGSIAQPS